MNHQQADNQHVVGKKSLKVGRGRPKRESKISELIRGGKLRIRRPGEIDPRGVFVFGEPWGHESSRLERLERLRVERLELLLDRLRGLAVGQIAVTSTPALAGTYRFAGFACQAL